MTRTDEWSARWCCEKLLSHDEILKVIFRTNNSIEILVEEIPEPVVVATMAQTRVGLNSVPIEFHDEATEFLLNIPKDAYYEEGLLAAAERIPLGVGGVADLYTAVAEREFRAYLPKGVRFILRGLSQHTAVRSVSRINDQTYRIVKHNEHTVIVLALNEYDLTVDALRSGIEKYGRPTFVLASNPNCRLSTAAKQAAIQLGTGLFVWRQLLGALNN